jgi:archaea-specific RecJ-like exonuclease
MKIKDIKINDFYQGTVKIVKKIVPGPTILVVTDATMSIDVITKDCQFNVNDVVEIKGKVEERNGKLQIYTNNIQPSNDNFDKILDQASLPVEKELSIKSEKLETLKPYFIKIAHKIRKSILEGTPILIRHHADADGITSGIAIEQACKSLMQKSNINENFNLYRSPSKAPFYEVVDAFKDVSFTKRMLESKGQNKPLIIVLDNGSTPEDVLTMKILNSLNFEIVVIDHHNPVIIENKKTAVCPYVTLHVNPYMEGYDGRITAGMLSYEIARLIDEDFENKILPAISAQGDKSDIEEAQLYKKEFDQELIKKTTIAMDYLAYMLKFDPGQGLYEELFNNNNFVNMLYDEVTKGEETQLQSTLPYLRTMKINSIVYSYIDLEKYTLRFAYPTPGKIIGRIHDHVALENKGGKVITIGYMSDMLIIRATEPVLPVETIIKKLQHDLPNANVEGGGHECAGTIKFVSAHLTSILENVKEQVKNI